MTVYFDSTFTPAVISAISSLRKQSYQVDQSENPIPGTAMSTAIDLASNATQGPFAISVLYNDLPQTPPGFGYALDVSEYYLIGYACIAIIIDL